MNGLSIAHVIISLSFPEYDEIRQNVVKMPNVWLSKVAQFPLALKPAMDRGSSEPQTFLSLRLFLSLIYTLDDKRL